MSEDKDGLKSIKVYRLNTTKENWHEVSLKFGVIADDRGYSDIIEGIVAPPDEKENLENLVEDDTATKKSKKERSSWLELQTRKGSETWLCQMMASCSILFKMLFQTN